MYNNDEAIQILKQTPLVSVLLHFGKRTDHIRYMYFSPFRDESAPSMKIDVLNNVWFDHGARIGGSVIDLTERLLAEKKHLPGYDDASFKGDTEIFKETLRILKEVSNANIQVPDEIYEAKNLPGDVHILSAESPFTDQRLVKYAYSRQITRSLLNRYCKQVSYFIVHADNTRSAVHTAIGFPNNSEGFALRYPSQDHRKGKLSYKSDITTIDAKGQFTTEPSHTDAMVFESWSNFLSFLRWSRRTLPGCDVAVLNSASQVKRAIDYIGRHKRCGICTDNDDAGTKAFQTLKESCPDTEFLDLRKTYEKYNDFNDFIIAESRKEKETEKETTEDYTI